MSRIGKLPVIIPDKVKVEIKNGNFIKVSGPLGELEKTFPPVVELVQEDNQIKVIKKSDTKFGRSMYGTARSIINSMVLGVSQGFKKELQIEGVGYRAEISGNILKLSLGYSHIIEFEIPKNIKISVKQNIISVEGFDKELVGSVAAKIRAFRKPDPYKGKGIKYVGEKILRKAGKTAK